MRKAIPETSPRENCARARPDVARAWLLCGLAVAALGLAGCRPRRSHAQPDADDLGSAEGPPPSKTASPPAAHRPPPVYPPREYTEPAPKLVVRHAPKLADAMGDALQGGSEGFRFVAKTVLLESKPSGWTLSVLTREVAHEEWFMETRSPQFNLRVGAIPLAPGVTVSGELATSSTLSFQSVSPSLAVKGYSSRVSYFVIIDAWDVAPFAGKWAEAGRAKGRLYFYVEPHACAGCFQGAQIAGAFEARVRYFTAPP